MISIIATFGLMAVISLWGCVYVGSLAPELWRQGNYRGAVGVGILACTTLILPTFITLLRQD